MLSDPCRPLLRWVNRQSFTRHVSNILGGEDEDTQLRWTWCEARWGSFRGSLRLEQEVAPGVSDESKKLVSEWTEGESPRLATRVCGATCGRWRATFMGSEGSTRRPSRTSRRRSRQAISPSTGHGVRHARGLKILCAVKRPSVTPSALCHPQRPERALLIHGSHDQGFLLHGHSVWPCVDRRQPPGHHGA